MAFFSFWQALSHPIYLKSPSLLNSICTVSKKGPDVKLANCHPNELLADFLPGKSSKALICKGLYYNGLKEDIWLDEKKDLQNQIMIRMFGQLAEIECGLISMRTKEGLAAARAKGTKLGRPRGSLGKSRLDGRIKEIKKLLALGVSKASIAKITGVSRTTLCHFIKSRRLMKNP